MTRETPHADIQPDERGTADSANHPCFNPEASAFARIHLPVAPGCNIQCHYCNRKFDCSNESRPGVTTDLLDPQQALRRVDEAVRDVPGLAVVAVAGPGEPLANASRTLRTLQMVGQRYPELRLCLSTNGLTLLDHIDRIVDVGVRHLTVTINAVDPRIGSQIYPWITYRGRRYQGRQASRILIDRQLEGLGAAVSAGLTCKVNSVLIPGINQTNLPVVSEVVRQIGATAHNVMPLISDPAHGTHFGLTGLRGPTEDELRTARDAIEHSAGSMSVMRRCSSCRSDAVGPLSQSFGATPVGATVPARIANRRPGSIVVGVAIAALLETGVAAQPV